VAQYNTYIQQAKTENWLDTKNPVRSSGISVGAGPTNDSRHWRHHEINLSVPAAIGGSPTGKCGLLPQHFYHRVNAVVVLLA